MLEKNKFIEQYLFEKYKDDCNLIGSNKLARLCKNFDVDYVKLYRRIINYRIYKYGCGDLRVDIKQRRDKR